VQRFTSAPNEYGTPIEAWSDLATLRAEVVEQSTEEFIRAQGAAEESAIVFRTRFLAGIGNGDRVAFGSGTYNIREVVEIGRRKGLEIRCREVL